MAKFISKEKMSKKAKKELAAQQRTTWGFSPVTQKVESKKTYNRKRARTAFRDDYGTGSFVMQHHRCIVAALA